MNRKYLCKINSRLNRLEATISGGQNSGTYDISGGSVIGSTLVLNTTNGTRNIPLTGVEKAIDFDNLTPAQISALADALSGTELLDAFGQSIGFLIG